MKYNHTMIVPTPRLATFLSISMMGCLAAATAAETKNAKETDAGSAIKPPTEIAIVALGSMPSRRYLDEPGSAGPVMLLARPGEIPPATLYYKDEFSPDQKTKWKAWNIPFNNPCKMKSISPGKVLALYQKQPEGDDYQKYVSIPAAKEGSRRVVFLTPSSQGPQRWNSVPLVRSISLGSKRMQGKQLILKNLSRFTVLHAFEDSVTSVPPMQTISYKRAHRGELYRLAAQYGTRKKIIYNTAVRLDGHGNIHLFALYDANPKTNAGRSVGVFRTMIPAAKTGEESQTP
jgi:hypothetical protein